MKKLFHSLLFGMVLLNGAAFAAQTNDNVKNTKQLPPKYVMDEAGNGWKFLMGPAGAPKEALLFYRMPDRAGGVSIVCRRGLSDGVIVKMRNGSEPIKKPTNMTIAIGNDRHDLVMRPGPENSLIFQGPAGIAMLNAMASIPEGRKADFTVSLPNGSVVAQILTPSISRFPYAAEKICSEWTKR